ncbi:hypothetical protein FA13DRAFT_288946 [Coprinellus micaceus]|uniref:DUF6533 domain-containing protein n=1 Tax=Coprinellus micaceus TaxID=71717 RepID=A0A4Y7TDF7_COPMI|nr:hypothetical protein FA13DRAFT_288946 [Coprinellus micaceus]
MWSGWKFLGPCSLSQCSSSPTHPKMDQYDKLPPAFQKVIYDMIVDGYTATTWTNYLAVSGYALIAADYLHTLPDEIRLMWPSPWSFPKVVFFVLRYYIFPHHVLAAMYGQLVGLNPKQCYANFMRLGVSTAIVVVIAENYLVYSRLRLCGQRQEDGRVPHISIHRSSFVLLVRFLGTVKYTQLPFPNMTCMPVESNSNLLGGVFSMLLGSVIIVMGMMIYFVFTKHRNFNSALLTIFYRDGIFYFLAITVLASANIIVNFAAPTGYKFLFIQTEADIHTILATRMLLHLRAWAEREQVQVSGRSDGRGRGIGMGFSTTMHSRREPSPMKFEARRIAAPMDSFGTDTKVSEMYPMSSATSSMPKGLELYGNAV